MNDFRKLLDSLQFGEDGTENVQVPYAAPQATMPDSMAEAAKAEAMDQAPVAKPAPAPAKPSQNSMGLKPLPSMEEMGVKFDGIGQDRSPSSDSSSMTSLKTKISGTIPNSDPTGANETAESRLERLMRDLNDQRNKERDEAEQRKFKADIAKAFTDNIGTFVGGMQAKNTKAHVTPVQTKGYDVGDLVGQVDKKFAGDKQALLDQYQMLLNARDRADNRKYQQEQLEIAREGNRIKQQIADKKASLQLTPGQEAQDKDFGKSNNEWTTTGRAKFHSNLGKLQEVADQLNKLGDKEKNEDNRFQGRLPDIFQPEDAINMRESVRSAAQESLRATLGAQFTEKEGAAIMNRAYDPNLSPASNLKRINAVINELKQKQEAMDARSKEFEQNGTLSKFQSTPNAPVGQMNSADPKIEQYAKQHGLDYAKAESILRSRGYGK